MCEVGHQELRESEKNTKITQNILLWNKAGLLYAFSQEKKMKVRGMGMRGKDWGHGSVSVD